jgi:hypothetical protein
VCFINRVGRTFRYLFAQGQWKRKLLFAKAHLSVSFPLRPQLSRGTS